jgi:hypothetical protein
MTTTQMLILVGNVFIAPHINKEVSLAYGVTLLICSLGFNIHLGLSS